MSKIVYIMAQTTHIFDYFIHQQCYEERPKYVSNQHQLQGIDPEYIHIISLNGYYIEPEMYTMSILKQRGFHVEELYI